MTRSGMIAGFAFAAALIAAAPVHASGQQPIYQACLSAAKTAPNPQEARNQCVWDHWDRMAEYG